MNPAEARALARLGAAAAGGEDDRLRDALPATMEHVTAAEVEELLLQTYLFAGFPRAINAFFVWQGWAVTHGVARPRGGLEKPDAAGWRTRGEALCRVVYGSGYEALQERMARLHPALAEWTLVEGYGKVLSRPGPDAGQREIAAVGALVAIGAARQLHAHLLGAVRAGVPTEVVADAARATASEWSRGAWVEEFIERLEERS